MMKVTVYLRYAVSCNTCSEGDDNGDERTAHRNGYRERTLKTRVGTMNLKIPKLRSGSSYPSFLEKRRRSEQALVAVIQEACIKGVSTRKVDDLVQSMGMSGFSNSQVSRFCSELDGEVQKFLGGLIDGQWPYVWLDATYLKSREDGHVTSRAVVVATGVKLVISDAHQGLRKASQVNVERLHKLNIKVKDT